MKEKLKKWTKRARAGMAALFLCLSVTPAASAAPDGSGGSGGGGVPVVDQLSKVGDFISGICTSVGAILLIIGIGMLGKAFFTHDTAERPRAIEFIVGALILGSAGLLAKFILS